MTDNGWRPMRRQKPDGRGAEAFEVTPFVRLARVHAVAAASDAAVAVALAGSIFFSISPDESRARVALYLALTMAPFAVVTPLIGPAIDRFRGGRRMMIIATAIGRVVLAFLMISYVETLFLFPLAFGLLVLQKSYSVAKSAVVPQLVQSSDDLVDTNSRLSLISALVSMSGAAVAGFFSLFGGPSVAAGIGMMGYIAASILAFQLTPVVVAAEPAAELEKAELRDAPIVLAGSATAVLRGIVGFVTFLLAFEFRGGKDGLDVSLDGAGVGGATATARGLDITGDPAAPLWHFGVVLLAAGAGALSGAKLAPALRQRFVEERMLQGVLLALVGGAVFAALSADLFGAIVLSLVVAMGASAGKLAFDALVQRDAPDANHGRSFARFEARFQIAWVIGAFFPAIIHLGLPLGSAIVAAAAGLALVSYLVGRPIGSLLGRTSRAGQNQSSEQEPAPSDDDTLAYELSQDDVRPSQPDPPAATGEWVEASGWVGDAAPWVSSVEGVEIHPDAAEASDSAPADDE